jgi:hypothetical protein
MIFLAGSVLVFGGVAGVCFGAVIEHERILKASGFAAIIGAMLWLLESAAPRIMETMP